MNRSAEILFQMWEELRLQTFWMFCFGL
jgi:hypothetical protein